MKILVIPDTHFPWVDYPCLHACYKFAQIYKPDVVVQVGDLVDQKAWSQYPKDPSDPSPADEWQMTVEGLTYLHKLFPDLTILEGNHCRRIMCRALEARIPKQLIKTMDQMLNFEGWKWHLDVKPLIIDNIFFIHGDEMPGRAFHKAARVGKSVVQGHDHLGYLEFINTYGHEIFGMSCGSMLDRENLAAKYSAKNLLRSWTGWATVTHGEPALHRFKSGFEQQGELWIPK